MSRDTTKALAALTCAAMLTPVVAEAGVRIETEPDGTIRITNRSTPNSSASSRARIEVDDGVMTVRLGTGPMVAPRADLGQYDAAFEAAASRHRLPTDLVKAVARVESAFDPRAVSHAGAEGLMQLMPATASAMGVADPFDPLQSIEGGARYLRKMLDRFGELDLALAAYNAGPEAVERHGGIPPFLETRRYVRRVMDLLERWRRAAERMES